MCLCERFIYSQDRSTYYYYYYSTIYPRKTYQYHLTITYTHLITITLKHTHNTTLFRYCRTYMSTQNFIRPRRFDLLYWIKYIGPHVSCSRSMIGMYKPLTDTWMWKLWLLPRNSFSGNIFFLIFGICSLQCGVWLKNCFHEYALASIGCAVHIRLKRKWSNFFSLWREKRFFFSLYSHASETLDTKRKQTKRKIAIPVKVWRSSSSI